MVCMRGRPAAIRLPNAITKMAGVTGRESISERIMAAWLVEFESARRSVWGGTGSMPRVQTAGRSRAPTARDGVL
jgi:hypothetical protein